MEIDPEELKKFVRSWLDVQKKVEADLLAHVSALAVFAKGDPEFVASVLDAARRSPKIAEILDPKYAAFQSIMTKHIEEGSLNQAFSRFLQDWEPEGPKN